MLSSNSPSFCFSIREALLISAFLVGPACIDLKVNGEDTGEEETQALEESRVIGTIHGVVRDSSTQSPLEGVSITWARNNQILETTTDADGFYAIAGLPQGDYELVFVPAAAGEEAGEEAGGYAGAKMRASIPTLHEIGVTEVSYDSDFEHSVEVLVDLYPLNAELTGTVIATLAADGSGTPTMGRLADGATVVIDVQPNQSDYWVIGDRFETTTDTNGTFSFAGLPATPSGALTIQAYSDDTTSYGERQITVNLVENGATDTGQIYVYNAAEPPVILAHNFIDSDDFELASDLELTFSKAFESVDAQLSQAGGVALGATVSLSGENITVDPNYDLTLDTHYEVDFNGTTTDGFNVSENFKFSTHGGIELLSTNLRASGGTQTVSDFRLEDNITLEFSLDVDISHEDTGFVLSEGGHQVYTSVTVTNGLVEIDPLYSLEPNTNYQLDYQVRSSIEGDQDSGTLSFQTLSDTTVPNGVTSFELQTEDIDWTSTQVNLEWDSVSGAEGYRVYARDNFENSSLVLVAEVVDSDHLSTHSAFVTLPTQFDHFQDDGIQTPFTAGRQVTFNVTAYNSAGEGALVSATDEIVVSDNVGPVGWFDGLSGNPANNLGTTDSVIQWWFTAPEYATSAIAIFGAGTGLTSLIEWDSDARSGVLEISVLPGVNLCEETVGITFQDTSGNNGGVVDSDGTVLEYVLQDSSSAYQYCEDIDQDGRASIDYGGDDCNDLDATISPAEPEIWYDGIDQDCGGQDNEYDADGDGHDSNAFGGDDCDDTDYYVNPSQAETWYDGIDSDCNGASDYDADEDGDDRASDLGTDCDDNDATVYTGAAIFEPTLCTRDSDGDGWGALSSGSDCLSFYLEDHWNDSWDYSGESLLGVYQGGTAPEDLVQTVTMSSCCSNTEQVCFTSNELVTVTLYQHTNYWFYGHEYFRIEDPDGSQLAESSTSSYNTNDTIVTYSPSVTQSGTDCNDSDSTIFPGNGC